MPVSQSHAAVEAMLAGDAGATLLKRVQRRLGLKEREAKSRRRVQEVPGAQSRARGLGRKEAKPAAARRRGVAPPCARHASLRARDAQGIRPHRSPRPTATRTLTRARSALSQRAGAPRPLQDPLRQEDLDLGAAGAQAQSCRRRGRRVRRRRRTDAPPGGAQGRAQSPPRPRR